MSIREHGKRQIFSPMIPSGTQKTFQVVLGLVFLFWGAFLLAEVYTNASDAGGALFGMFRAMVPITIGAVILSPLVSERIGQKFIQLMYPNDIKATPNLSMAQSLIVQRRYQEAVTELEKSAEAFPDAIEIKVMLADLFYTKIKNPDQALSLILETLNLKTWDPEFEKLVMLAVDIYLEKGKTMDAKELLGNMIEKPNDAFSQQRMTQRRKALS